MNSQHLFNWIRAAKEGRLALPADEGAVFVPIVTAATEVTEAPKATPSTPIEIGIKDFVVRAVPGIDMRLLERIPVTSTHVPYCRTNFRIPEGKRCFQSDLTDSSSPEYALIDVLRAVKAAA